MKSEVKGEIYQESIKETRHSLVRVCFSFGNQDRGHDIISANIFREKIKKSNCKAILSPNCRNRNSKRKLNSRRNGIKESKQGRKTKIVRKLFTLEGQDTERDCKVNVLLAQY